MVAQILFQPVSGRNTSIITRRQSQPDSLQYNSRNPYSPSGRSCRWVAVTDLVSRAPNSGNLSRKGIIGMAISGLGASCEGDCTGFSRLTRQSGWTNRGELFTVWWMSAGMAGRARQPGAAAKSHRHSNHPNREQLQRENERLQREVEDLRRKVAERDQQIADAEKQIADLERQLALRKRNSTNSSKPPSSDGLAGEQRPRGRKHKSKRKAGAQPGHAGHHRQLVAPAEVSTIEVVLPKQCRHCGGNLAQKPGKITTAGEPRRHQVTEVPPVKAHITEYQFPNVVCGHCRKTSCAPLPEEIRGNFGPQLTALIAYWTVVCRLPRRLVEGMLADVLGIQISLGSTQKAWEELSQAVEQPVQHLQAQLPHQAVLNVDETGWRTNGDKRWMWALVAQQFVFYVVASTRGAEVLVSLLGAVFRGILCSDRWVVYLTYHSGRMQLCWLT